MARKPLVGALLVAGAAAAVFAAHPVHALQRQQQPDRPLRVVTKPLRPFVMKEGDELTGYSVELWDQVARDRGWTYEWVEVETVTQQLEAVQNGSADVAIAGISMTPERERQVDFTHPYFRYCLQILTTAHGSAPLTSYLKIVFSPAMLRLLAFGFVTLLVMSHLIWLFERKTNPGFPKAYFHGVGEGMWWAVGVVASGTYGDAPVTSKVRRLVAMVWIVLGIVLIAQFTASVTSQLTVQQLTGYIDGPSDLPGKAIATVDGSTSATYLRDRSLAYRGVDRIEDAYLLLERGNVQAVVYDAPVLAYYAATDGQGKVQLAGDLFKEETYGIALSSGSALREPINESLLKLNQDGTTGSIYNKWFGGGQ